jgi:hypothetical protein
LGIILEGYIRYEQLFDGSITIYDVFLLNNLMEYKREVSDVSGTYYLEKREQNARKRR